MSTFQLGLIIAGGLVLIVVVAYNAWTTHRNAPKRAEPPAAPEIIGYDTVEVTPPATYAWFLQENKYLVSFRIVEFSEARQRWEIVQKDVPSNLMRTTGAQAMMIVGGDPGNNVVLIKEVITDPETGDVTYADTGMQVSLNVQAKKPSDNREDPSQNDLFTILKIYWADLQWFWLYELHPTLKHLYFVAADWVRNIPTMVKGWFVK